jgi:hypothetical protein
MEKPIIFSTDMVKAILEGRKTQTRRVIKPQPPEDEYIHGPEVYEPAIRGKDGELEPGTPVYGIYGEEWGIKCPYVPGMTLWVRETWYYESHMYDPSEGEALYRYVYKADNPDYPVDVGVGEHGWKPSIHMPREAARLFLRVKNVWVERLQEINDDDVEAEGAAGIHDWDCTHGYNLYANFHPDQSCRCGDGSPQETFARLWDSIYAKRGYGWNANPWVWVVEFERMNPA